jgi:hypothetical protein
MFALRDEKERRLQSSYEVTLKMRKVHSLIETPIIKESSNQLKGG